MRLRVVAVALLPITPGLLVAQQGALPLVRFGIVIDGPSERNPFFRDLFQGQVTGLLAGRYDVRFPTDKERTADWSRAGVEAELDRLLADPDVDMLLTLGVIASEAAARRGALAKPVVAPFVIDADLQDFPKRQGASGVRNLSYIGIPSTFARDVEALREVAPFENLAILVNRPYLDALTSLGPAIETGVRQLGLAATIVPVEASAEAALAAIPAEADAVYVGVLTQFSDTESRRLAAGLIEQGLPSYTAFGEQGVAEGYLVSINPSDFWTRIARRTALNVERILLGEEAGTIPYGFERSERLSINMRTARAIGVSPPWAVLTEAVLLDTERVDVQREVFLALVAQEAVDRNLDLLASGYFVDAGAQQVRAARSILFPQVGVDATASMIDADRADASFGTQPERAFTGSARLTQLVVAEPAWANLSIEGDLQRSREESREIVRLDVVLDAGRAYLNVLRLKAIERIQQSNLRVTRTNLELAQVRQAVGTASAGEVARWEAQLAAARKAVIDANAERNLVEIELNRILDRPLEEPFRSREVEPENVDLIGNDPQLLPYLGDPDSFDLLRDFLAQEALEGSPELRQLDAVIAAQRRELASSKNAFWVPEVALFASLGTVFAEGGAGAGDFEIPGASDGFPQRGDVDWSLGLQLSYPLFTGGGRAADQARASFSLDDLTTQRASTAQQVEQRLRSVMHEMGASYAGIGLARDAANASRRNLDLVTDAYRRGLASIVDLLDAQNAALVAELEAANSAYDFLIDVLRAERAIGSYSFFDTAEEREAFFLRLQEYDDRVRGQ